MQYSPTGRILHKTQTHDRMSYDEPGTWVPQHKTTYDWEYKYEGPQPHAATHIGENTYTYDANGNQLDKRDKNNQRRQILWDEENRMRAIADNGTTHHYIYDAAGERVIKSTGDGQAIYVNGFPPDSYREGGSGTVGNYTMYVNPFIIVSNSKYTKHFYIEGLRIVSKLGEMGVEQELLKPKSHAGDSTKNPVQWDNKKDLTKDIIIANFEALGLNGAVFTAGKSGKMPYGQIKKYFRGNDVVINPGTPTSITTQKTEDLQFYYHPDHLGSSNYITDASGEVYQHQEYFPFGETFVEERNDAEYTTYLFNGKELDEETGLYYYGARYYDPRTAFWLSVDGYAEKYSSISGYAYCANNPILFIDPDGREIVLPKGTSSKDVYTILGNLQKLTNDKLVYSTQKDGTIIKVASLAKSGTETKVAGTNLIRELNSSDKSVTIVIGAAGSGNSARPDSRDASGNTDWTNSTNGTGDNVTVNFDPTSNPSIKTVDPKTGNVSGAKRPNQVGLAHELIHADHMTEGDVSFTPTNHTYQTAGGNITQTKPNEELRTVGVNGVKKGDVTENQIRKEQGQNPRGAY